ncbi:hypothetical protein D9758_016070 [Tetrapyrgos nigripes]|uniref:CCHC-type domain-containing protein n=1 Tax=Tetrapyrgos nigripes TaxID=182062 RepID=A0A8H5C517_9AGAR|nr:hypothetical protein D9758_016070 [Tetrapyrgos nigripes]
MLRELEEMNHIPEGSIVKTRWCNGTKDGKKYLGQHVAHLYLYITTPETANRLVINGLLAEGARCPMERKILEDPRCFHCNEFGHISQNCPQHGQEGGDIPICGNCGEGHDTRQCMNSEHTYCVNCKTDDHSSRDRSCPTFQQCCSNRNKHQFTNALPFFPTDEDWTWATEPTNAP